MKRHGVKKTEKGKKVYWRSWKGEERRCGTIYCVAGSLLLRYFPHDGLAPQDLVPRLRGLKLGVISRSPGLPGPQDLVPRLRGLKQLKKFICATITQNPQDLVPRLRGLKLSGFTPMEVALSNPQDLVPRLRGLKLKLVQLKRLPSNCLKTSFLV